MHSFTLSFDYHYQGQKTTTFIKEIWANSGNLIDQIKTEILNVNNFTGDYEDAHEYDGQPLEEVIITISNDDGGGYYSVSIFLAGTASDEIIQRLEQEQDDLLESLNINC